MVRMPNPTVREVRWAFIVVFVCAVALTATICWAVVHKVSQSDQIVRVAASSAAQVDRLSEQIDATNAARAAQDAESARQRRQLKAQNRQVHAELGALLRYLRAHGINVPRTALQPPARPQPRTSRSTRPKAGSTHPASKSPRPASPDPTATPTPTTPGDALCGLLVLPACPLN